MEQIQKKIDLHKPKWDQSTYLGRAKHFFVSTNPLNILKSNAQLDAAKKMVDDYQNDRLNDVNLDELWKAKYIVDSAFHPDTGEKMMLIGRMSAQVPMNMTITGFMLTFYKTTPTVIFWQWINQSFNAIVNYTNRAGDAHITNSDLMKSYALATTAATTSALGLQRLAKGRPMLSRLVPFGAVALANCLNIPFMRQLELKNGLPLTTEKGEKLDIESTAAAKKAITAVVVSRIAMAIPSMTMTPAIMQLLEKQKFMKNKSYLSSPIQIGLCGFFLIFATPLCCALFPQRSSLQKSQLEEQSKKKLEKMKESEHVFFNKGL
ncbi:hypothetical protein SNEBB_002396 [Seison nebaliae]|nr:hypothetical protein SNEBB_002396 [Seison nebaliae]